jgi:hypothetical protein
MRSGDKSKLPDGAGAGRGVTSIVAVRVVPLIFAESVTVVLAPTTEVVTGKLTLAASAGTVTLAGT